MVRMDICGFLAFGCKGWVNNVQERRAKGKHMPRSEEAIYDGFAINTYVVLLWSGKKEDCDHEPIEVLKFS
jgi:hypothetical protein